MATRAIGTPVARGYDRVADRYEGLEPAERWHRWLEPGGRLLFTIEPHDEPGYDAETTPELLERTGFHVVASKVETQVEGGRDVDYLWVLAEA
jgi:hypothetical protein